MSEVNPFNLNSREQFREILDSQNFARDEQWWATFISACRSCYSIAPYGSAERKEWGRLYIEVLDRARENGIGLRHTFSRRVVTQLGMLAEFGPVKNDPVLDPELILKEAVEQIGLTPAEFGARYQALYSLPREEVIANPAVRKEISEYAVIRSALKHLCEVAEMRELPAASEWCAVISTLPR